MRQELELFECGPKRALTGFLTAMFRNKPHRAFASNHPKQGQSTSFLHCLASIYALQPERLQRFMSNSTQENPTVSQASSRDQTQVLETIQNKDVIVCSGASVGLPGGEELFSDQIFQNYYRASTVFLSQPEEKIVLYRRNRSTKQGCRRALGIFLLYTPRRMSFSWQGKDILTSQI